MRPHMDCADYLSVFMLGPPITKVEGADYKHEAVLADTMALSSSHILGVSDADAVAAAAALVPAGACLFNPCLPW